MFRKFLNLFSAAFIGMLFAISAASAANNNVTIYLTEYDVYGNFLNSSSQQKVDTFQINAKSYSYNGWVGQGLDGNPIHQSTWQTGCFYTSGGTKTFGNIDRWSERWNVSVNVPSNFPVTADLVKYNTMLVLCNSDGSAYTGSSPFSFFIGDSGITTLQGLNTESISGRCNSYKFSGYTIFSIPYLSSTNARGSSTSYYARHTATGVILEMPYDYFEFAAYGGEVPINVPEFVAIANEVAASSATTRSSSSDALKIVNLANNETAKNLISKANIEKKIGKKKIGFKEIEANQKKVVEGRPLTETEEKALKSQTTVKSKSGKNAKK